MITYATLSESGSRENNEDSIKVYRENDTWVFALADGLGGCGYGSLASEVAVESLFCKAADCKTKEFFDVAFNVAQQAVFRAQKENPQVSAMSTTLVVLRLQNGEAQWAHVGDSRLYRFHGWFLREQTRDHSVPQILVDLGRIRPDQIRHHADRNRLLAVIGRPWDQTGYEISDVRPLARKDAFLLCSDGFWEYITERGMRACLFRSKSAQDWMDRMAAVVRRNGDTKTMDNFSAICIKVE